MDHITSLIQAQRKLLSLVRSLRDKADTESIYFNKCEKLEKENLLLQDKIAKLEMDRYNANKKIEQDNITILRLKSALMDSK